MNGNVYIWDMDGTLIDSYDIIATTLLEMSRLLGTEATYENVMHVVKSESVTAYISILEQRSGKTFDSIKEQYSCMNREKEKSMKLIPNAAEVLAEIKRLGGHNYIYTHRGLSTYTILHNTGIEVLFEDIVTASDGFKRKPEPDAIDYLVNKHQLDRTKCFYVGDREIDMACAERAKMKGILYLPKGENNVSSDKATYIVDNLINILAIK